jgi:hypothetical protein
MTVTPVSNSGSFCLEKLVQNIYTLPFQNIGRFSFVLNQTLTKQIYRKIHQHLHNQINILSRYIS